MSSILTNVSAMSGLNALRGINNDLATTQDRISSGLKVASGADNAAYFSISETMKGDNSMLGSIQEGLTLTRNSVSTARLGAETVVDFTTQIVDKLAFAQANGVDRAKVQEEIDGLVAQVNTTIAQATFNGDDLVSSAAASQTVVTGVGRGGGTFAATTISFDSVDLSTAAASLGTINIAGATDSAGAQSELTDAEAILADVVDMATSLGIAENSISNQQKFLDKLQDNFKEGIGSMVDANMEEEAARLKSLQVQQQLANTALSISNSAPQQLLSLFR